MLLPSDIKRQLDIFLPRHTDLFSTSKTVTSAESISTDTIRVETSEDHGLVVTDLINVTDGRLQNTLTAVEYNSDSTLATFTTESDHDFTTPRYENDPSTVEFFGFIFGFWNTVHDISDIPSRTQITVPVPSGASTPPTLTGTEVVYEDRPSAPNGLWPVTAVNSTTEFEFTVAGVPALPLNQLTDLSYTALRDVSVAVCANFERAVQIYTAQTGTKHKLFVIFNDLEISKDRHMLNDLLLVPNAGDNAQLLTAQNFSTTVFFDISDKLSGADAQELAYGDVFNALMSSLYTYRKDNYLSKFGAISTGHGPGINTSSSYAHVFDWQFPLLVDRRIGFSDPRDVAMRNMQQNWHPFDLDNPDTLDAEINLD